MKYPLDQHCFLFLLPILLFHTFLCFDFCRFARKVNRFLTLKETFCFRYVFVSSISAFQLEVPLPSFLALSLLSHVQSDSLSRLSHLLSLALSHKRVVLISTSEDFPKTLNIHLKYLD